jgi:intracellular sulfur oxidation DsrE/DsrF family protein
MSEAFGMTDRRGFVGRVTAAVALGAAGLSRTLEASTPATTVARQGQVSTSDAWVESLKGKHRQLFDMAEPEDGVGLLHVRNYLLTYRDAYHAGAGEVNALVTLYGKTTPLAFNDAMWAKYKFGAALDIKDPKTGQPTERNLFYHTQQGDTLAFGFLDSAMENLQKIGASFILCNNALNFFIQRLVAGGAGTAEAIRADLLANMLPGITLVPAMVIAINRAQEHGLSYMKLG